MDKNPQLAYKNDLQFGDVIVVYNPDSLLHRLIDFVTGKKTPLKAGHVAMVHDGIRIVEANSRGVAIKECKKYSSKHTLYVRRYKDLDEAHIFIMVRVIDKTLKHKYSFFQLPIIALAYIFKKSMPDVSKKAEICSELIAGYYERVGVKINKKEPQNVAPIDFLKDNNFITAFHYSPVKK